MLDALLALVFPERCAACDVLIEAPGLCLVCAESLYPLGVSCPVCAEPQARAEAVVCPRCRALPPPFARAHCPWRYGGELATALRRMKYGGRRGAGRPELARSLAVLLAPALRAALAASAADVVVPVPLHRRRLRSRGFSQAEALTVAAAPRGAVVDRFALARARDTLEQAGLGRAERQKNVAGAFEADPSVRARRILLVDDVITTGATAAAAATALRTAGASHIELIALARAEP